jgi:uncharacterized protein with von Willebrand factor type A (vWA) domain
MTSALSAAPVTYVPHSVATGCGIDADGLFRAMAEDLLHDGNVDLSMQKAFRWGFQDDEGEKVTGLRDLMQRLRDDRQELLASLESSAANKAGPDPVLGNLEDVVELGDLEESDHRTDADMDARQMVGKMEVMERSLRQVESIDDLQNLDPELMSTTLTDAEQEWVGQWARMKGVLEAEGLVMEVGDRLDLTPRAIRRIGEPALAALFSSLGKGSAGDHDMHARSRTGVLADSSSPWQYGDPFAVDLSRTIMNSVRRHGLGAPVRMAAEDFEVLDRESRTATASVLLIDMSRSMFYNGCWDAAKRSALALDTLLRTQFQRDDLELAGFSERAERLSLMQLPSLEWNEYSHGTNLEDGLRLARELLRPYRGKTQQIILVTDGEPTAYNDDGKVTFENPPTGRTFDATLREVMRCTRENVTINTFLLDHAAATTGFIEDVARINLGRVIHATADDLGHYLIRDFLSHRTMLVR